MLVVCHINLAKGFRGGERQTELLIRTLCKHDDIFQKVIVRKDSPLLRKLDDLGHRLEFHQISKPYIRHAALIRTCSLCHVHEAKAGQFAYFSGAIYKRPYLITRRVPNAMSRNPLTFRIYLNAARLVALSGAIKEVLMEYNRRLKPIIIPSMVSNLAVDQAAVDAIRSRYKGKFLVGHAGALVKHHKGQQYILKAAARLQNELPQIHFLLFGQGQDERELKEMAKGLMNVEFLGFQENLGDFLNCFDLFVFPSLEEGLGSVLLDAMQFRLPIVASEVDGIPDIIIHQRTGLLIPPGSGDALTESIRYLYHNHEMRKILSDNAYSASRQYRPEVITAKYLQLYREITEENKIGAFKQ